jgi:hypothetical protein
MLTEPHDGLSGGHLGINNTLNKVQQRYYHFQARNNLRNCAANATPMQPVMAPEPGIGVKYIRTMSEVSFERIDIDVAGPFPQSD